MTIQELIELLKHSVIGSSPNIIYDPEYNPKEEELGSILKLVIFKYDPRISLDDIPQDISYIALLEAKKELYHRLAVKNAPLYKIESETVKLDKATRFEHYYKLIQIVQKEIQTETDRGTGIYIQTGELLIDGKYQSKRNYEHSFPPTVEVKVDNTYDTKVEVSWSKFDLVGHSKFRCYYIYISNMPIIDIYNIDNNINKGATLVRTIYDIHTTKFRIENLKPDTQYYIAVISQDINSLSGYSETSITTNPSNSN